MLKVSTFTNPSGDTVFRASGTVAGKRVRRNFKAQTEAQRFADQVNDGAEPGERRHRALMTWLEERQVREAELAADLLGGESVLDFVRSHGGGRRKVRAVSMERAIREFTDERAQSGCRERTVKGCRGLLDMWARELEALTPVEVSREDVRAFVLAPGIKAETKRDRRKHVRQFMAWCVRRGYASLDPSADLPQVRVERDPPRILTVQEAERLLEEAEADEGIGMMGYAVLGLFSGVRPEEARRLEDGDFHLRGKTPLVEVTERVAKVRQVRHAELSANAVRMLRKLDPPLMRWSVRAWKRIRREAGLYDVWENDLLRHTYASYHYAMHRDIRRLTYTMGNSEGILFRHYIRPVTRADARRYFGLV